MMKRRIIACAFLVLGGIAFLTLWKLEATRARQPREAIYRSVLGSYQAALPPATSREQVENYLESKAVPFDRICCTNSEGTSSDIVKIAKEPSPHWYCSRTIVYVEFRFSTGTNHFDRLDSSDLLKAIALDRKLEDCL